MRRIVAKAEHSATGTNLRFLVTNCSGRSAQVFRFYNERGECENRIEEFKNGFRADRLSCHRFLANAFRLLLHTFAYNLVNLFRLHLPLALRSAQIETLRTQLFKIGARVRQTARCVRIHLASGWPFSLCFKPSPGLATPANSSSRFELTRSWLLRAEPCRNMPSQSLATSLAIAPSPNLTRLLPLVLDSNNCSAHFPALMINAG